MERTLAATPRARLAPPAAWVEPLPMIVVTPRAPLPLPTTRRGSSPRTSGLELVALPDEVWHFLSRAWFFVAGITMGVLLAACLVAVFGRPAHAARQANHVASGGGAAMLVVARPSVVLERALGEVAMTDAVAGH